MSKVETTELAMLRAQYETLQREYKAAKAAIEPKTHSDYFWNQRTNSAQTWGNMSETKKQVEMHAPDFLASIVAKNGHKITSKEFHEELVLRLQ